MKFKGKCVPIEHEPREEQKGTGRMMHNLHFFRHHSGKQKMCAKFGKRWCGNVETGELPVRALPKTTASFYKSYHVKRRP